jgi:hypothetical protein
VEGLLDGDLKDYFVSEITMAWKTNHFILSIPGSFIVISQAEIHTHISVMLVMLYLLQSAFKCFNVLQN